VSSSVGYRYNVDSPRVPARFLKLSFVSSRLSSSLVRLSLLQCFLIYKLNLMLFDSLPSVSCQFARSTSLQQMLPNFTSRLLTKDAFLAFSSESCRSNSSRNVNGAVNTKLLYHIYRLELLFAFYCDFLYYKEDCKQCNHMQSLKRNLPSNCLTFC